MARKFSKSKKGTKTLSILFKISLVILIMLVLFNTVKITYKKYVYPTKYSDIVISVSNQTSVDPYLIYSIIKTESGFNTNALSNKNAKGLMQVLDDTASEINSKYNLGYSDVNLHNAEINIKIGTIYFSSLISKYNGNYYLAICAYNAGMGNVDKWLDQGIITSRLDNNENIPFNETKNYLKKVISNYKVYKILYK
ncbi:MAG: lytic transglycosylase domain-containing protein [Clostridia bacterium]|nr:lytic transglycosylase domain-containing protein [Clostridia bacterium]